MRWSQARPSRRRASGAIFPSSVTQTVIGSGSPDLTVYVAPKPSGGPVDVVLLPDSNRNDWGCVPDTCVFERLDNPERIDIEGNFRPLAVRGYRPGQLPGAEIFGDRHRENSPLTAKQIAFKASKP